MKRGMWVDCDGRFRDGLLQMLQTSTLHKSMSRLSTQHTEVSGWIILGHVTTDSRAVFFAMTDFHAVRTYDRPIPETSFVGVSIACARSTDEEGGGV